MNHATQHAQLRFVVLRSVEMRPLHHAVPGAKYYKIQEYEGALHAHKRATDGTRTSAEAQAAARRPQAPWQRRASCA
jgi:hypothetical protein